MDAERNSSRSDALDKIKKQIWLGRWFKIGQVHAQLSDHKNGEVFLSRLTSLSRTDPVADFDRMVLVGDQFKLHDSVNVKVWLAEPSCFERILNSFFLGGDVCDQWTRNHNRAFLAQVVTDALDHFQVNGHWKYQLSEFYFLPEVDAEVKRPGPLAGCRNFSKTLVSGVRDLCNPSVGLSSSVTSQMSVAHTSDQNH